VGVWDIDQIAAQWQVERIFEPIMARAEAAQWMDEWRAAVKKIMSP
jgi:glycerol kinase